MNEKPDDINSKMEKDKNQDEDGDGDDCKPAAQEKSQDKDDDQDDYNVSGSNWNQAERKEGRSPSAWVVKSFQSISSLMKDSLYIFENTEITK